MWPWLLKIHRDSLFNPSDLVDQLFRYWDDLTLILRFTNLSDVSKSLHDGHDTDGRYNTSSISGTLYPNVKEFISSGIRNLQRFQINIKEFEWYLGELERLRRAGEISGRLIRKCVSLKVEYLPREG